MEGWNKEQVYNWLKTECDLDEDLCQRFLLERINGECILSCSDVADLRELVPELPTGPAKIILNRMKVVHSSPAIPATKGFSPARQFKESAGTAKYIMGTFLVDEDGQRLFETGPDTPSLLYPVREFKQFVNINKDSFDDFRFQALRFAFACINSRANGTIYFGIEDKTLNVVGCALEGISPEQLTDRLQQCIAHIFPATSLTYTLIQTVRHCLHNPKFIDVYTLKNKTEKFVIEIDVESKYEFVQDKYFEISLSKYLGRKQKKSDADLELFVRDGTSSKRLQRAERKVFIDETLKTKAELRRRAEGTSKGHNDKRTALESMLRGRSVDPFDGSTYPVLILDKLSTLDGSNDSTNGSVASDLSFIGKYCKWKLVIDLNNTSQLRDQYMALQNTVFMTVDYFREQSRELQSITDKTWWLHANGNEENRDVYGLNEWKAELREEVIITLITQLRYMSPKRCLVVFLFLNDSDQIMTSIYQRFYKLEFCRVLYIAEYEYALENLRDTLPEDEIKPFVNGIVGLPWKHVENIFRTVSGQPNPECEITTSSGAFVPVKRENWSDLDILGATECADVNYRNPENREKYWKERCRFYSGNPVSWLNCALSSDVRAKDRHIIKRNEHAKLKKIVQSRNYDAKSYEVVTIFHHAGAGGSTLARHVLWELKDRYKCAVIKSISKETKGQIEEMYRFGEETLTNHMLKPVVLVLDLPDPEVCRIFLNELNKKQRVTQLVSVIIYCKRTSEDNYNSSILRSVFCHGSDVFLGQKFSSEEKSEFLEVLDILAKNQDLKFEADIMLGFMALISDEVEVYVRKTIKRYISASQEWEKQLLKFVALFSTYYSDDPDIPAAFFDFLIPEEFSGSYSHWEDLNNTCGLFCTVSQKASIGSVHCFRIKMYPIFAKELLDHLRQEMNQKLSDIVLEFLNCNGFKSFQSHSRHNVTLMTKNMIRKRNFSSNRNSPITMDRTKTRYSDLINDILAEEKNVGNKEQFHGAVQVAKRAFQVLLHKGWEEDAFLAQLVARILSLEGKQFDEAIEYAEKAKDLRPNDSFQLDTMGQVFKEKLKHLFPTFRGLALCAYKSAIDLARSALKWFTSAIEANDKEREINYSPYIGHVGIFKSLFELLQGCEQIFGDDGKENLKLYLSSKDYIPVELEIEWREHHAFMKQLSEACEASLRIAMDRFTLMKPVKESQEQRHHFKNEKLVDRVIECYNIYREFMGGADTLTENIKRDAISKMAWNRNQVTQMGGLNFHTIMELGMTEDGLTKLLEMQILLKENTMTLSDALQKSDIEKLLLVTLSLTGSELYTSDIPPFEIYSLCAQYLTVTGEPTSLYNLVMLMLLWPQDNIYVIPHGITYNDETFKRVLRNLKSENELNGKHKGETESELECYLRTGRKRINYKMRTVFYLSRRGRNKKFIYTGFVKLEDGWYLDDQFWSDPRLEKLLGRVRGVIQGNVVVAFNEQTKEYGIRVPIADLNSVRTIVSEGPVQFYLGFSWDGPKACGIVPIKSSTA